MHDMLILPIKELYRGGLNDGQAA